MDFCRAPSHFHVVYGWPQLCALIHQFYIDVLSIIGNGKPAFRLPNFREFEEQMHRSLNIIPIFQSTDKNVDGDQHIKQTRACREGSTTPTWDWIVKIEISLIFLLSLSNLNFYKILVKNWTIMKNFMPDFTCMVLQSVIQEKAFLKINFLIAMTSNIFNTQILLNLNFNEDLWNKILL